MSLAVIQFSDSFQDLWKEFEQTLDVPVQIVRATDAKVIPQGAAAVVLAAGGAEPEALEWLESYGARSQTVVLAVGADPNRRTALRLVTRGADDYLVLPEDIELLRNSLEAIVRRWREAQARVGAAAEVQTPEVFDDFVGESPAFREVLLRAARVLPHRHATALILGETGTGKELLARAIHDGGPRRGMPFVPVNCSALPDHLIESELFGHERGAFTDAHAEKPGLFEVADGGTIFLDEISTMPMEMQAKLLRVLEDPEVRRVGGTKSRRVDVRIIAATNEDPQVAIQRGTFREDLYFRLSVITLRLPPLRERDDDVILVADAFLHRLARQHGLPPVRLSATAQSRLRAHHWPGNVRELRNAVERALLLSPPGELNADELIPALRERSNQNGALPFPAPLDEIDSAAAQIMLDLCRGNRSEAARRLHVSRRRLRRLVGLSETASTAF